MRELEIDKDIARHVWRGTMKHGMHSTFYEIPADLLESLQDEKYIEFINRLWEKGGWALRLRLEHTNE